MSVEKKPRAPRSGQMAPAVEPVSTEVETHETLPSASDTPQAEAQFSRDGDSLSPADAFPDFAVDPAEVTRRTQMLKDYVRNHMAEGEDYGIVPGGTKPTLFKAGAEKLNAVFGLSPLVEVTAREENWDDGFVSYEVKVSLFNKRSERVDAEGIGSCNSRERRYKNQDAANIANTVLKMAKKRALVDATLSATRASGMFTQDLEDMDLSEPAPRYGAPVRSPNRDAQPENQPIREGGSTGSDLATDAQHRAIMAIAGRVFGRHSRDEDVLRLAKKPLEALSKAEASALIDKLRAMLGEPAQPSSTTEPTFARAGRNGDAR
ncbi:hypothetical protein IAD21_01619 [Abditibacteriota bacterium]|nr:hypothetical protein IAD21_01619 [Abditibacteriota bacterium]